MNEERKTFLCYQCKELVPIPPDFMGDKYALLEVHYLLKHDIDIRSVNWQKPMTIHRVLDLENIHNKKEEIDELLLQMEEEDEQEDVDMW
jgi:hypothetical protein